MKKIPFFFLATFFIQFTALAQSQSVTFSEISDKFCRNMEALMALYSEKDLKESIAVVIDKAGDLKTIYSSGGARAAREKLMKEKEALDKKSHLDQADMDRQKKLEKDIKTADPDGSFKRGRDSIESSIGKLELSLKNLDTSVDDDKANLVALTLRHLQVYRAAIRLSN